MKEGLTQRRGGAEEVKLPAGLTRAEEVEALRETLRMAEERHREDDPAFVRWPDMVALIDYLEIHGCLPSCRKEGAE